MEAGYEPFGNPEGPDLIFRSPEAWLSVLWDRGYLSATIEPRGHEGDRLDDELFRQAVDGEAPLPEGTYPPFTDLEVFLTFLRDRLPEFERAALAPDPELRARIAQLRDARAARWERLVGKRPM